MSELRCVRLYGGYQWWSCTRDRCKVNKETMGETTRRKKKERWVASNNRRSEGERDSGEEEWHSGNNERKVKAGYRINREHNDQVSPSEQMDAFQRSFSLSPSCMCWNRSLSLLPLASPDSRSTQSEQQERVSKAGGEKGEREKKVHTQVCRYKRMGKENEGGRDLYNHRTNTHQKNPEVESPRLGGKVRIEETKRDYRNEVMDIERRPLSFFPTREKEKNLIQLLYLFGFPVESLPLLSHATFFKAFLLSLSVLSSFFLSPVLFSFSLLFFLSLSNSLTSSSIHLHTWRLSSCYLSLSFLHSVTKGRNDVHSHPHARGMKGKRMRMKKTPPMISRQNEVS